MSSWGHIETTPTGQGTQQEERCVSLLEELHRKGRLLDADASVDPGYLSRGEDVCELEGESERESERDREGGWERQRRRVRGRERQSERVCGRERESERERERERGRPRDREEREEREREPDPGHRFSKEATVAVLNPFLATRHRPYVCLNDISGENRVAKNDDLGTQGEAICEVAMEVLKLCRAI
jgi:hypothetical protein